MPLTEIELRRTPHDRRLYALPGFGTVRFEGFWTRRGVADADGERWVFGRTGFWKRIIAATDPTGSIVGRFVPRDIRRGGKLSWRGAEYTVAPASLLRERYAQRKLRGTGEGSLRLLPPGSDLVRNLTAPRATEF